MALHTKWSSGDQIWYDGTQEIFRIKNGTGGLVVGQSDEGVDFKFYGDTTGAYFHFDESADLVDFHNINTKYRAPASPTSTGANITLTSTSNRIQFIANATSGNSPVLLPASTSSNAGDQYTIFQTSTAGGEVIVYNGTTGGATVATIAATEGAIMISNGTVWRAIVGPET